MPDVRVTELGYEIELEPIPSVFVTELGYDVELEPVPSTVVTEFAYEIEFRLTSEIPIPSSASPSTGPKIGIGIGI